MPVGVAQVVGGGFKAWEGIDGILGLGFRSHNHGTLRRSTPPYAETNCEFQQSDHSQWTLSWDGLCSPKPIRRMMIHQL